jgi:O-antigen/teichoic acid export membrane protein
LRKKYQVKFTFTLDRQILKTIFKIAVPLALIAIFSRIYGYLDQIMVSKLVGDAALALYATAMKIPFALQFIPSAFAAAIFPAFSHAYSHDKERLRRAFERAMMMLTVVAVPLSLGIFAIAREAIFLAFGEKFLGSVLPLQILVAGLIFIFLNFPLGSLLTACDKQVANTKLVGLVMVLNIILNIFLIPKYSFIGASCSFVLCHALLFVSSMFVAKKIIDYRVKYIAGIIVKSLFAAGAMAVFIIYVKEFVSFLYLIPVGALIYLGLMFLIKGITVEDVAYVWRSIFKLKKKVAPAENI